ncbi:LysR family transcriptional regulator [Corynebacterium glaucum]|uniref:LysR family transcriptional regulator n=1 Tax=Corynebacterium glaucum TaxID=187491 RepID=UPI002659FF99|nr:LysR family transcriptional regulator [Corynebacterium glaucum]
MELQQFRYVVAIAEERNFTRAAERCFVVQSALSHQIKALEKEIGTELFVRTSRRVELTTAGEAFLIEARASLTAADRAALVAAEAVGRVRGTLAVGVIPTVSAVDIPELVATFHDAYPEVVLTVHSGGSDEFLRGIGDGTINVGFLGLDTGTLPAGVDYYELAQGRHVAVVPAGHELATRSMLNLSELVAEPFIDFPTGSPGRVQVDNAFSAAGVQRRVAFEAMSIDFMLALVRRGLGVCLLPPGSVPTDEAVAAVSVQDGPQRTEYLAWDRFNPSPPARAFVDHVIGEQLEG